MEINEADSMSGCAKNESDGGSHGQDDSSLQNADQGKITAEVLQAKEFARKLQVPDREWWNMLSWC